jgi:hypothetical protein
MDSKEGASVQYTAAGVAPPSYNDAPPSYTAGTQQNTLGVDEKDIDAVSINSQAPGFNPTIHMDVVTEGFNINYITTRNWGGDQAIPVFRLAPGATPALERPEAPEYISIRPKTSSNSCALVQGSDPDQTPLISTVYRWGPGRDPHMRVYGPGQRVSLADAVDKDKPIANEFEVKTHWVTSRSASMVTPYGKFEWRYGKRSEKKEASKADSLLVLDRLDSPSAAAGASGSKSKDSRVRVAQLIRNAEFRTEGTSKWNSGGNGGRLLIDLSEWAGQEKSAKVQEVEAFVVASLLLMLKRETDRMKDNQIVVIS